MAMPTGYNIGPGGQARIGSTPLGGGGVLPSPVAPQVPPTPMASPAQGRVAPMSSPSQQAPMAMPAVGGPLTPMATWQPPFTLKDLTAYIRELGKSREFGVPPPDTASPAQNNNSTQRQFGGTNYIPLDAMQQQQYSPSIWSGMRRIGNGNLQTRSLI